MKNKYGVLRRLIRSILLEINIDKLRGMKGTHGSTHEMNRAQIVDDEREFFVKFSDIDPLLWSEGDPDPSMQCMSEYLAYRIYSLYPGVRIPSRIELVFDPEGQRVGLATAAVKGKMALGRVDPKNLAKQLQAGVYVDIFLANYDVIGTGTGNLLVSPEGDVTRIDPGSSFKYRARGARPKDKFNPRVGELETMLDPSFNYGQGAGHVYQFADLKAAAREFLAVPWEKVAGTIDQVEAEVAAELAENGMSGLRKQWKAEVKDIKKVLVKRYGVVQEHARTVKAA
jgi:hypothetical protein